MAGQPVLLHGLLYARASLHLQCSQCVLHYRSCRLSRLHLNGRYARVLNFIQPVLLCKLYEDSMERLGNLLHNLLRFLLCQRELLRLRRLPPPATAAGYPPDCPYSRCSRQGRQKLQAFICRK